MLINLKLIGTINYHLINLLVFLVYWALLHGNSSSRRQGEIVTIFKFNGELNHIQFNWMIVDSISLGYVDPTGYILKNDTAVSYLNARNCIFAVFYTYDGKSLRSI